MFICLRNEFLFMFCFKNFSFDIRNFHPFPCLFLFLFLLRLRLNKTLRILLLGLISRRVLFFPVKSTVKKTPEVCLFVDVFLFSLLHRKQRKMTGQFKGIVRASKRGAATARQNKKHKKKK